MANLAEEKTQSNKLQAAHTPGPWIVGKPFEARDQQQKVIPIEWSSAACVSCGKSDGNWLIGWLFTQSLPLSQQKANASLIAAAPEMLEALEAICGESESWHAMHGHESGSVQCDSICALIPKMQAAIQKAKGGQ